MTSKQIAEEVGVSLSTVNRRLGRIYQELGIGGGTRGISRGQLRRALGNLDKQ